MFLEFASSIVLATTETVLGSVRATTGVNPVRIRPQAMRSMLLSFDESIQGKIPAILGDTHRERVDTIMTLLDGTTEEDLNVLLAALQDAIAQKAGVNGRARRLSPAVNSASRSRPRPRRER